MAVCDASERAFADHPLTRTFASDCVMDRYVTCALRYGLGQEKRLSGKDVSAVLDTRLFLLMEDVDGRGLRCSSPLTMRRFVIHFSFISKEKKVHGPLKQ